jgi:hypothetical protein
MRVSLCYELISSAKEKQEREREERARETTNGAREKHTVY